MVQTVTTHPSASRPRLPTGGTTGDAAADDDDRRRRRRRFLIAIVRGDLSCERRPPPRMVHARPVVVQSRLRLPATLPRPGLTTVPTAGSLGSPPLSPDDFAWIDDLADNDDNDDDDATSARTTAASHWQLVRHAFLSSSPSSSSSSASPYRPAPPRHRLAVTEKHTSMVIRGKRFAVAVSDMQGWRISESSFF